jgi:aspartate 1-decarboxylase
VTISGELMDAAGMLEHEQVHVWNVTRGTRLVTYTIRGDNDSGIVCINGAAAHLVKPGDKVILATFAEVEAAEATSWKPTVVFVDDQNRFVREDAEVGGPKRRLSAS